jgi:large subunit ribosomal protein L19
VDFDAWGLKAIRASFGEKIVSMEIMNKAVASQLKKDIPVFAIGDSVDVSVRIIEGDKERIQVFSGTVIARRGHGMGESFIVRRIVNNEGVERSFPLHSPKVAGVRVIRGGRVRRAKLYYLRDRVGKATRLKELKNPAALKAQAEPAQDAQAASEV